jgi:glycosyltransferase involved in cell wall biosynthesis
MKILLVGNYLNDGQESMLRFAASMAEGLSDAGHDVRTLRPKSIVGRPMSPEAGWPKWLGYVDKFVLFPAFLKWTKRWADVVHICDHSNAMYTLHLTGRPVVVTCHDMLAVRGALGEETDCPASLTGKLLQRWIVAGLRRADKLACVSSATYNDVKRTVRAHDLSAQVIPNGLNYRYSVLPEKTLYDRLSQVPRIRPKQFLLHVGSNLRRKNREGILRMFSSITRSLDIDLVLAGSGLTPGLRDLAEELGISSKVVEMVKPSNEILEALYNSALVLLYPSRFEGFGWPIIEAQACGCPVVCSRCAPFKEVVGDAALMRDVDDEDGFVTDVLRLARNPQELKALRCKGLQNIERFLPDRMTSAYISLYQGLLADSR